MMTGTEVQRSGDQDVTTLSELLPELREWNNGKGIEPLDYVYVRATSEMTIALASLFWPEFATFEGYVLRTGFNLDNVRNNERAGWTRSQVEAAASFFDVGGLFGQEPGTKLLSKRIDFIGGCLVQTYCAKLATEFPGRKFNVRLVDKEEDFYLTFFQEP